MFFKRFKNSSFSNLLQASFALIILLFTLSFTFTCLFLNPYNKTHTEPNTQTFLANQLWQNQLDHIDLIATLIVAQIELTSLTSVEQIIYGVDYPIQKETSNDIDFLDSYSPLIAQPSIFGNLNIGLEVDQWGLATNIEVNITNSTMKPLSLNLPFLQQDADSDLQRPTYGTENQNWDWSFSDSIYYFKKYYDTGVVRGTVQFTCPSQQFQQVFDSFAFRLFSSTGQLIFQSKCPQESLCDQYDTTEIKAIMGDKTIVLRSDILLKKEPENNFILKYSGLFAFFYLLLILYSNRIVILWTKQFFKPIHTMFALLRDQLDGCFTPDEERSAVRHTIPQISKMYTVKSLVMEVNSYLEYFAGLPKLLSQPRFIKESQPKVFPFPLSTQLQILREGLLFSFIKTSERVRDTINHSEVTSFAKELSIKEYQQMLTVYANRIKQKQGSEEKIRHRFFECTYQSLIQRSIQDYDQIILKEPYLDDVLSEKLRRLNATIRANDYESAPDVYDIVQRNPEQLRKAVFERIRKIMLRRILVLLKEWDIGGYYIKLLNLQDAVYELHYEVQNYQFERTMHQETYRIAAEFSGRIRKREKELNYHQVLRIATEEIEQVSNQEPSHNQKQSLISGSILSQFNTQNATVANNLLHHSNSIISDSLPE